MTETDDTSRTSPAPLLGAVCAALSVYALAVEPYRLEVTCTALPVRNLPRALEGLSILLLTDPHIARWGRRERLLASLLDTLPTADIVVWGGDFLNGATGIPDAVALARRARARVARYGVLGNAEHKLSRCRRRAFVRELEAAGLRVLINESEPLTIHGTTITLAGTDDPYYGHANLKKTLAGADPDRFTLLLSHSPQIALQAARAGVDLLLSGHTHGGQVRLPLIGALKTQNPLGRTVDAGFFDRARLAKATGRDPGRDIALYVSRGIGVARLNILPLYPRFLCRPEIAWLTLVAK